MKQSPATHDHPSYPGNEPPQVRYSDEDAALILRQAALLEQRALAPRSGKGFTLNELQEIAAEAGIEPRHVTQAAAQLRVPSDTWAPYVGATTRFSTTHEVEGEIPADDWEQVVDRVRETLRTGGRPLLLPGKLDWRSNDQPEPPFHVRVESGAGKTRIQVDADGRGGAFTSVALSAMYTALFAGILADTEFAATGAELVGILAGGAVAGAAGGRLLWRRMSRRLRRRVDLLVSRLAEVPAQADDGTRDGAGDPPQAAGR